MIEPHNAVTVQTSKPMPPAPQAKLRVPMSEAFYATLLAEDAKRIRKRHGDPQKESKPVAEGLTAKQARYRAIQAAKTQETRQTILDALARPSTAGDVATRIKRDEHMIRRQLVIMAGLGLVEGQRCKNVVVWHRKGEA
jgi:ABC-type branched-subunit amino acid transport system substrate-binding protein